jgi:hypothetical protein
MSLARDFLSKWNEVVHERKEELLIKWKGPKKQYTNLIIHNDDSIVNEVAALLSLNCFNGDYYCVDSVFYKDKDRLPGLGDNCVLKDHRISFEHENDFNSGLYQEVSHLLLLNCDLKVLVAYPNNEGDEKKELINLHKIISSNRQSKIISEEEGFLILFCHEHSDNKLYKWKGWVYVNNEEQWSLIS